MAATVLGKAKQALGLEEKHTVVIAGHRVQDVGFGLMGLTWKAKPPPTEQSFAAMKEALAAGVHLWNGGELYGPPDKNSLHLLQEYFTKYPEDADKVVICIKGGMTPGSLTPDGSAENTRRSIDEALKLMPAKKLDMWEAARVDPDIPVEITMRAANEYVKAGKLGGICLSECSEDTIRRAAKEVKVCAVELEFSLWETTIVQNGIAKACAELNIPIVAYSPLGRGFLTGQIRKPEDIPEDDMRRGIPRFQPAHFDKNLDLLHGLERIAKEKGATTGQIAIAWVKAQSRKPGMPVFIPIPGASSEERVKENFARVYLTDDELKAIDDLLARTEITGLRMMEHGSHLAHGSSKPLQE